MLTCSSTEGAVRLPSVASHFARYRRPRHNRRSKLILIHPWPPRHSNLHRQMNPPLCSPAHPHLSIRGFQMTLDFMMTIGGSFDPKGRMSDLPHSLRRPRTTLLTLQTSILIHSSAMDRRHSTRGSTIQTNRTKHHLRRRTRLSSTPIPTGRTIHGARVSLLTKIRTTTARIFPLHIFDVSTS